MNDVDNITNKKKTIEVLPLYMNEIDPFMITKISSNYIDNMRTLSAK